MKTFAKLVLVFSCALMLSSQLAAQERDPLNAAESDQLREVAQDPDKRLKLLIKFAGERLDTVEVLQKEQQPKGRGERVRDSLQDFTQLMDELDDNIDDYVQKQSDMRKGLTEVVNAEEGFDRRLKAIKDRGQDPKLADEYAVYNFALQDATDAVELSLDDSKKTLNEQTGALGKKK